MIEVHPNILERNGKKEFQSLMEALVDYEDLRELREAKESEDGHLGTPV